MPSCLMTKPDEIEVDAGPRILGLIEARHPVHGISIRRDVVADSFAEPDVVLNQQNPHLTLLCRYPAH